MNKKVVKFMSCFMPSKKLRHKFRDKYIPKNSIIEDSGENNRLIILDDDGNPLKSQYLKNLKISFCGNNSTIKLYQSLNLRRELMITCLDNNVVEIGKSPYEIGISLSSKLNNNCWVRIGTNCRILDAQLFVSNESDVGIDIGNNCLFGSRVYIRTSDGHPIYDIKTGKLINSAQTVKIGNNCWVGYNAIILKGSNVPNGSIIGANSTFLRTCTSKSVKVQENAIWVGSPAKIVTTNVRWEMAYNVE